MKTSRPENTEKTLISRRTLLHNSFLTGLGVAAAYLIIDPAKIPHIKPKDSIHINGLQNEMAKPGKKQKDTYIDHFDC